MIGWVWQGLGIFPLGKEKCLEHIWKWCENYPQIISLDPFYFFNIFFRSITFIFQIKVKPPQARLAVSKRHRWMGQILHVPREVVHKLKCSNNSREVIFIFFFFFFVLHGLLQIWWVSLFYTRLIAK